MYTYYLESQWHSSVGVYYIQSVDPYKIWFMSVMKLRGHGWGSKSIDIVTTEYVGY